MLGYPSVSSLYYHAIGANAAHTCEQAVAHTNNENLTRELQACEEYNCKLRGSQSILCDPFNPDALRISEAEYNKRLNVAGNSVMASVYVPSIGIALPLYHSTETAVLERGIGHMPSSSLPTGGSGNHCVIAGHTGLAHMKVFDQLGDLNVGDYIFINVLNRTNAYRVYESETVLPNQTERLVIQPNRDLLTLITCVPYGINSHRLLVHAERCEIPTWWNAESGAGTKVQLVNKDGLIATLSLACAACLIVKATRKAPSSKKYRNRF